MFWTAHFYKAAYWKSLRPTWPLPVSVECARMPPVLGTQRFLFVHHREHQGGHGQEQGNEGQHQEVPRRGSEVGELRSITGCYLFFYKSLIAIQKLRFLLLFKNEKLN